MRKVKIRRIGLNTWSIKLDGQEIADCVKDFKTEGQAGGPSLVTLTLIGQQEIEPIEEGEVVPDSVGELEPPR